jgi:hypothetical protein
MMEASQPGWSEASAPTECGRSRPKVIEAKVLEPEAKSIKRRV